VPKLRKASPLCPKLRRRGGGRRERSLYANGATTMRVLGPVLNTVGLGLFCGLIFTLAVYAVPFFVAVSIGMLTFHSGAGVIGALLVGIIVGASTIVIGQAAFAMIGRRPCVRRSGPYSPSRPPSLAIMWFSRCRGLECRPCFWREVFACLGAVSVGAAAWMRLTLFAESRPVGAEQGGRGEASDDFDGRHPRCG
jgi:hypothetical protein